MYKDRAEAGKVLYGHLKKYAERDVIVLAIPRGGVVVAKEIASGLKVPLKLIVAMKIGAPFNPEFAVGALIDKDNYILDDEVIRRLLIPEAYIEHEIERRAKEADEYRAKYIGADTTLDLTGRTVILVDDGLATGYTALAAVKALEKLSLKELILAVPVAPKETLDLFQGHVDGLVCPLVPDQFYAVGQAYEDFSQTTDQEVMAAING